MNSIHFEKQQSLGKLIDKIYLSESPTCPAFLPQLTASIAFVPFTSKLCRCSTSSGDHRRRNRIATTAASATIKSSHTNMIHRSSEPRCTPPTPDGSTDTSGNYNSSCASTTVVDPYSNHTIISSAPGAWADGKIQQHIAAD